MECSKDFGTAWQGEDSDKVVTQNQSLITVGAELAALPKKLLEKI